MSVAGGHPAASYGLSGPQRSETVEHAPFRPFSFSGQFYSRFGKVKSIASKIRAIVVHFVSDGYTF
jgi:hypothetical protein